MQSVRQYRRFGKHVQDQYERDIAKAEALSKGINLDDVPVSSEVHPDHSVDTTEASISRNLNNAHDPEKAQRTRFSDSNSRDTDDALSKRSSTASKSDPPAHIDDRRLTESELMRPVIEIPTQHSIGTALGTTLTGIDVRDRTTQEGKGDSKDDAKVFVVGYEGDDDIMNPHNWSLLTRIGATVNVAFIGMTVGFASSVDSAAVKESSSAFGVSEVTECLATGLFLVGFGIGALFAGPVSETVGRNPVYIVTLGLYMVFTMASALAPNIGAQLAFRFIAGCFASTPLTCAGGSISDLWNSLERIYSFPVFANAALMGPILGPVVGGFIAQSSRLSGRWTDWITLMISGLVLMLIILFQPETYAPILLKWKAAKLRQLTGDQRYKAQVEIQDVPFVRRLAHALYRPFLLTSSEPVIILIALYLSINYVILFTFLNGFTFIFAQIHGFSQGITGLSFIGIGIGLCLATCFVPLIYSWAKRDLARIKSQGGHQLPPEDGLWFAMFGAPAIPISMFWMGWTAYSNISYWSPLGATVLFGYGVVTILISSYQYIIDGYESYAASALSSVTFIRYVAAGGMVEVAIPFYKHLGVHWTLTILGALSALMVPVPYLFYLYGSQLRSRSKYATGTA